MRVFPSTSLASSSSTTTWIAALVTDFLKMVKVAQQHTLTTAIVNTAYTSSNSISLASSSSDQGYGVANLRYSVSAVKASPTYQPILVSTTPSTVPTNDPTVQSTSEPSSLPSGQPSITPNLLLQ